MASYCLLHRSALTAACWLAAYSLADTVTLENGSVLSGQVVKDPELGRSRLAVDSEHGRIVIDRGQIDRIQSESPAESEYRRRGPTVSDTADAQFALATWCRNNGVKEGMERHLRRVLELEPDHAESRALLGFQQVDGGWMTRDQVLAARGLVRHEAEWRTRQEVAILERQAAFEATQIAWRKRLAAWRDDLNHNNPDVSRAAEGRFDSIEDPAAIGGLLRLFNDESNPLVRRKLIDVVGRLGTPAGLAAMAQVVLTETDQELRAIALEHLVRDGSPGLASPFVGALRSKNNQVINNAADALSVLGSQATLEPLIESLVTTHKWRVGNGSGGDQYSVNTRSGVTGFGGGGVKDVKKDLRNPRVLNALVALTDGVNYQYDKARWKAWLASQQVEAAVDLRRDE